MNFTSICCFRDHILFFIVITPLLYLTGCGQFFDQEDASLQATKFLDDIRQIKENPHVNNPLPELYRSPAKKMVTKDKVTVFYFTKQHSVVKLADLISNQFGYKVGTSVATNQLIIQCPGNDEADKVLQFLELSDVPPIQVNIDCIILERFADMTTDWESTVLIEDLFGEKITLGGTKTDSEGNLLPNFPGASIRETKRSTFGMDIGYLSGVEGHQIRALVDMLVSKGYLKILMNPSLETLNGQKAKITSRENVPIEKIVVTKDDTPYNLTDYQWVEDSLDVTPYVFADGDIGLDTIIRIGSKSKPEGVVQASVITERSIEVKENRIKPGQSLIIGGIRKTEERTVIRGTPFFKDLPLIGALFSSKDFEENATEVIFILTPSISSGGAENAQMMDDIRNKYAAPQKPEGFVEKITSPFYKSDPLEVGK